MSVEAQHGFSQTTSLVPPGSGVGESRGTCLASSSDYGRLTYLKETARSPE